MDKGRVRLPSSFPALSSISNETILVHFQYRSKYINSIEDSVVLIIVCYVFRRTAERSPMLQYHACITSISSYPYNINRNSLMQCHNDEKVILRTSRIKINEAFYDLEATHDEGTVNPKLGYRKSYAKCQWETWPIFTVRSRSKLREIWSSTPLTVKQSVKLDMDKDGNWKTHLGANENHRICNSNVSKPCVCSWAAVIPDCFSAFYCSLSNYI